MSDQRLVNLIASAERLLNKPYRCAGQDGPGWGEGWGEGDDPNVALQWQKEFWREAYERLRERVAEVEKQLCPKCPGCGLRPNLANNAIVWCEECVCGVQHRVAELERVAKWLVEAIKDSYQWIGSRCPGLGQPMREKIRTALADAAAVLGDEGSGK